MVTYKQLLEDVGGFIVAKGLEEDYIKFMNDKKEENK